MKTEILAALQELGSTPEDIAKTLTAAGVRGKIRDISEDPLAAFLRGRFGSASVVTDDRVVVAGVVVRLPPALSRFVAAFDAGLFPRLIKP